MPTISNESQFLKNLQEVVIKCEFCKYWLLDPNILPKDYGMCNHPKIHDMIMVGYCDDWDFYKDFGCILFEKRGATK